MTSHHAPSLVQDMKRRQQKRQRTDDDKAEAADNEDEGDGADDADERQPPNNFADEGSHDDEDDENHHRQQWWTSSEWERWNKWEEERVTREAAWHGVDERDQTRQRRLRYAARTAHRRWDEEEARIELEAAIRRREERMEFLNDQVRTRERNYQNMLRHYEREAKEAKDEGNPQRTRGRTRGQRPNEPSTRDPRRCRRGSRPTKPPKPNLQPGHQCGNP